MVEIETQRLLLRRWREEDLDAYVRVCADPEVMRYIGGGVPLTRAQSQEQVAKFTRLWEERGCGLWAVEERASGSFIGFVGLARHDDWTKGGHKTDVGWQLDRSFWGRGLATEAAIASVRYGFEELGLERIISIIQPANLASRRVAEKTGLTLRGETRWSETRWRGRAVVWYAIGRDAWRAGEPAG